jgi:hypothetical protein
MESHEQANGSISNADVGRHPGLWMVYSSINTAGES